jgi:hypothetical protein
MKTILAIAGERQQATGNRQRRQWRDRGMAALRSHFSFKLLAFSFVFVLLALAGCFAPNTAPDGTTPGCYDGGPTTQASQPADPANCHE